MRAMIPVGITFTAHQNVPIILNMKSVKSVARMDGFMWMICSAIPALGISTNKWEDKMKKDREVLMEIDHTLTNLKINHFTALAKVREIIYLWRLGVKYERDGDGQIRLLDKAATI